MPVLLFDEERQADECPDRPMSAPTQVLGTLTGVAGGPAAVASSCGSAALGCGSSSKTFLGQAAGSLLVAVSNWLTQGAQWLLAQLGHVLLSSTAPPLASGWFASHVRLMADLGVFVILPLLLLAVGQAAFHQDPAAIVRVVAVQLPLSVILGAACVGIVQMVVSATDELSLAFAKSAGFNAASVFRHLGGGLGALSGGPPPFVSLLLAIVLVIGAVGLWIELVLRSAAILVATLFLPLVLSALVWPATAAWSRRLAETLAALILAKLAIVAVIATGSAAIPPGSTGASNVISGAAMVLLATFMPFALLRLFPTFEAAAVGHLDGVARRSAHSAIAAASSLRVPGAGGFLQKDADSLSPPVGMPPLAESGVLPDSYLNLVSQQGQQGGASWGANLDQLPAEEFGYSGTFADHPRESTSYESTSYESTSYESTSYESTGGNLVSQDQGENGKDVSNVDELPPGEDFGSAVSWWD